MTPYPPAPWRLFAHAYIGVFLVPAERLPNPHAPDTRPITIFGRGIVAVAFFVYEEPSPLTYGEVMQTVLVRDGWRIRISITDIWVDSPASRDGGRELWSIPKELATFAIDPDRSYTAQMNEQPFARVRLHRPARPRIPLRFGFRLAQGDPDRTTRTTPVRVRGRFGLAGAGWWTAGAAPFAAVSQRRPVVTLAAHRLRLIFGS